MPSLKPAPIADNAPAYERLRGLLEPRSVAVIGASDQAGNLGGRAVMLLRKYGFPGNVSPVNPKRESVAGVPCYPSLAALPEPAELAIIAVSAERALAAVSECVAAGTRHGVLWAGGFAEAGDDGAKLQQTLADYCRAHGFLLCGPNCLGIINAWQPLTATFASSLVAADRMARGDISMVSQSGGTAMGVQQLAQEAGFGFRLMISCGNEAVLDVSDYIEALVDDPATAVIAAYLEGTRDGARLANAFARARSAGKPVVVLKAGRTAAAALAAAAHTGALAGDDRVWSAVFDEHAVVAVRSQRELIDACLYLSSVKGRLPVGNGVAISTFGGGVGVLSADLCAQHGLTTPPLGEATRARLASLAPSFASTANPVDHTPATFASPWIERFPEALDAIAADPAIHAMFFPLSAMATGAGEVGAALADLSTRSDKPICVSWMFAPPAGPAALARARIHPFAEPARAVEALAHAAKYAQAIRRADVRNEAVAPQSFDWTRRVPAPVAGQVINEDACHRLLADAGLPVARARLARDEDDAVRAAHEAGLPVAMKGISSSITHRAAAGLLALDLRTDDEVRNGWRHLAERAREIGVRLEGAYVQQMASGRLEILVSALRDPVFGVIVACGAGGNLTEIIDDVALARAPFGVARAEQVLSRLRIVQCASRVDPGARIEPLAAFVSEFSRLVAGAPWRRFVIEINPIKWRAQDVVAVDGLIIIEDP
jgi:acetyltransferase